MKKLKDILEVASNLTPIYLVAAIAAAVLYFSPDRIIDKDKSVGISKLRNGCLVYKDLVDKNADGIGDYLRSAIISRPNGGQFIAPVPEDLQKEYSRLYQRSKFYKYKIENGK